MVFPLNVGLPIGEGDNANKEAIYMLEIHYDNPERNKVSNLRRECHFSTRMKLGTRMLVF